MLRLALCASIVIGVCAPCVACVDFGRDDAPIARVQASWDIAQHEMNAGRYAEALTALRAAMPKLSLIHNALYRGCVADGSEQHLAMAKAGERSEVAYPGDLARAKAAADRAWRTFPARHDCP